MKMNFIQSCKFFLSGHQKDATWMFFIISIKLCVVKKIPDNNAFLRTVVIWYGISFQTVGVTCPDCVPSQDLAYPQPTGCWGVERGQCWKGNLDALPALLSSSQTLISTFVADKYRVKDCEGC